MGLKKGVLNSWVFLLISTFLFFITLLCVFGQTVSVDDQDLGYCLHPVSSVPYCEWGSDNQIAFSSCCPDESSAPSGFYGTNGAFTGGRTECLSYFALPSEPNKFDEKCTTGYCFEESLQTCKPSTYTDCYFEYGDFVEAETIEGAVEQDSRCQTGCCCYKDSNAMTNYSIISTQSYCEGLEDGTEPEFHSDVSVTDCPIVCGVQQDEGEGTTGEDEEEVLSDCEDGIDNDHDGRIDYNPDGEGDICCFTANTNNGERCAEELGDCSKNTSLTYTCNCIGSICNEGQYCCDNVGCVDYECSSRCEHDMPCGEVDENGCALFKICQANGSLSNDCRPRDSCLFQQEICYSPQDDNDDGKLNCEELYCDGQVCADSVDNMSNCMVDGEFRAYRDTGTIDQEIYKCCYSNNLRDCDEDGIKETCGECDCLELITPPAPVLAKPRIQRGVKAIFLNWTLKCPADFILMKCDSEHNVLCGSDRPDQVNNIQPLDSTTQKSFVDTGISANTKYCYKVIAVYNEGSKRVTSSVKCVYTGDEACMLVPFTNFCVDETYKSSDPFDETLYIRATCSDNNTIEPIQDCRESGPDYICKGPFGSIKTGVTECVRTDDCQDCGGEFNVFADKQESLTKDSVGGQILCSDSQTCYYDSSNTSIDYFHSCLGVQRCHDYLSEYACEQDASIANNKCLSRDCTWVDFNNEFGQGICMDVDYYNKCEICNDVEFNSVFGACTEDKCQLFGDCFLRSSDGLCVDFSKISCNDYTTKEDCIGDQNIDIDVEYNSTNKGQRIGGTHEVIEESHDRLGLGKCKWNETKFPSNPCFKDSNDDNNMDPGMGYAFDFYPPTTTLLTQPKTRAMNISFIVSDYEPDGDVGSGVMTGKVFFCKTNRSEEPCYPNQPSRHMYGNSGWIDLGGGSGKYDVYYYAIDNAHNLEEVKKAEIELDRKGPGITINYTDYKNKDSHPEGALAVEISVDEESYCTDYFYTTDSDDTGVKHMINQRYGTEHTLHYTGLDDGYYRYRVECTDTAGNVAHKDIVMRVDIDPFIYYTAPQGPLNYTPISLTIHTEKKGSAPVCKWSEVESEFSQMYYDFSCNSKTLQGSTYYECVSKGAFTPREGVSKTYSIDVKCKYGNKISDDEIEFVYDLIAPNTTVEDAYGNEFDSTKWYGGNSLSGKIFLKCTDYPIFGFGCDETYYCSDDKQYCSPENTITYEDPVEYDIGDATELKICYRSQEQILKNMGGLWEDRKCQDIQVDRMPPRIELNGEISAATTEETSYMITDLNLLIEGQVKDPDVTQGLPDNTLSINIYHIDGGGTTTYTDIEANSDFEILVELKMGMNMLEFDAVDRSGTHSGPPYDEVYVYVSDYDGQRIYLIDPPFGVSTEKHFEAQVGTYKGGTCKFSYIDNFNSADPSKVSSSKQGTEHTFWVDLESLQTAENQKWPVSVWCNFDDSSHWHKQDFYFAWDSSDPVIEKISIDNSNGKEPAYLVEPPLETNLMVKTDDDTRCKYTTEKSIASFTDPRLDLFPRYDAGVFNGSNSIFLDNLDNPEDYGFYIQCENEALARTDRTYYSFKVDTSMATGIYLEEPPIPTSETKFNIKISTSKVSEWCRIGRGTDTPSTDMTKLNDYEFMSSNISLSEGKHRFNFKCLGSSDSPEDYFDLIIDTSAPLTPEVDDGVKVARLDTMSASWVSSDTLTDIVMYQYAVGTFPGGSDVVDWLNTTNNNEIITGVNLTKGKKYFWAVKAMNEVGLWSNVGASDGFVADPDYIEQVFGKDSCSDGEKNFNESDIDCGGDKCDACLFNSSCIKDKDCLSKNCVLGKCAKATCDDNIQNQNEADIDCGGPCDACGINSTCNKDEDCFSKFCYLGKCKQPTCDDGVKNGEEEGVDCGGPCSEECKYTEGPDEVKCKIERVAQYLGEDDTDCDGIADVWEMLYELDPYSDDASLDPDQDGRTNYQEFLDNTHPFKPDTDASDKSKGLFWLILLIILIVVGLVGGSYYAYETYYDQIPPQYRKYIDMVVNPVRDFIKKTYKQIADFISPYYNKYVKPYYDKYVGYYLKKAGSAIRSWLETTPLAQYLPTKKTNGLIKANTGVKSNGLKSLSAPQPSRAKAPVKINVKEPNLKKVMGGPIKINVSDEYEDASSTKELISMIREKRKKEKEDERNNLISRFDEGMSGSRQSSNSDKKDHDLKVKKKELLEKVEEAFSDSDNDSQGSSSSKDTSNNTQKKKSSSRARPNIRKKNSSSRKRKSSKK